MALQEVGWHAFWRRHQTARGRLEVVMGLALIATPTACALWPSLAQGDPVGKAVVGCLWVLVAAVLTVSAVNRDRKLTRAAGDRITAIHSANALALDRAMDALCAHPAPGVLDGYEVMVFLPKEPDLLRPVYPFLAEFSDGDDPREFEVGKGATGRAWEEQRPFIVTGADVSNERWRLTEAQRQYFAGYQTVAATVMHDALDNPVGVVTVISRQDDGAFAKGAPGHDAHFTLARVLGTLLTALPVSDD